MRAFATRLLPLLAAILALCLIASGCASGDTNEYIIDYDADAASAKELYKAYFYDHFTDSAQIAFADVTGDGNEEKLVVSFGDNQAVSGDVFTIDKSSVRSLHHIDGSEVHAGGFFNWYLLPLEDGTYALVDEISAMWQGNGQIGWRTYTLRGDGSEKILSETIVDSHDAKYGDGNDIITDEAYEQFCDDITEFLSDCSTLYSTASCAREIPPTCMLAPEAAFQD